MNGNHIAYARFDGILMIDGSSLAALFSRNRVATIYEDVAQQRGKPGRPARLVAFENEAHQVFKPQNSLVWNREFFGWLDKYVK